MTVNRVDFSTWLNSQLAMRGWRPIDLSNAANLPNSTIIRILNGDRRAGPDVATAIAHALEMKPEDVFRRAGLLPPKKNGTEIVDPTFQEIVDIMRNLPPEERQEVLEYALFRYRRLDRKS